MGLLQEALRAGISLGAASTEQTGERPGSAEAGPDLPGGNSMVGFAW